MKSYIWNLNIKKKSPLTSPRSSHRLCPICRGLRPPDGPVSGCRTAAELYHAWPGQTSPWCRRRAAWSPAPSGTPARPSERDRTWGRTSDGRDLSADRIPGPCVWSAGLWSCPVRWGSPAPSPGDSLPPPANRSASSKPRGTEERLRFFKGIMQAKVQK